MADVDPLTRLAQNTGCFRCGKKSEFFYWVEYYILPSKLVRKRHKDKNQVAIYCQSCYEENGGLMVEINGQPFSVSKTSNSPHKPSCCLCCGREVSGPTELYGLITFTLMMAGSVTENFPLAYLCSGCVEKSEVFFGPKAL